MAAPIAFVSKTKLDEKREEKRKAQKLVLEKAKQKYEREERKRKLIKERGDDKWMLPSVSDSLNVQTSKRKERKKEKKEKRRHKKSKKRKTKDVSREEASSSSGDDSDEEEWVEAETSNVQPPPPQEQQHSNIDAGASNDTAPLPSEAKSLQRDTWMESPFLTATYSSSEIRKQREEKRKEEKMKQSEYNSIDNPGQSSRELNPFWKNGGTGLPEEEPSKGKNTRPVGVGDKGVSWLRKSYERVKHQAEEEGRPFEELAAERWGSLEKIHAMLAEAEGGRHPRSANSSSWRKSGSDERDRRRDVSNRSGYPEEDRHRGRGRDDREGRDRDSFQRWKKSERDEYGRDRDSETKGDKHRGGHSRDRYDSPDKRRGLFRKPGSDEDGDNLMSSNSFKTGNLMNNMRTKFKKPGEDGDDFYSRGEWRKSGSSSGSGSWRKPGYEKSSQVESPSQTTKQSDKGESKKELSRSVSEDDDSGSTSSSSSSEEEAEEDTSVKVLTKDEMNQLGAKLVKAEIMGNQKLVEELKKQLEMARQAAANQPKPEAARSRPSKDKKEEGQEEVILSRTNKRGQSYPLPEESGFVEKGGKKRKKRKGVETHNKEGLRERYFGDDDNMDLKTMVQKEKMSLAEDQNNLFSRAQARALKSLNDEYTLDDMFVSSASKQSSREDAQKERDRAIREHQRMEAALSRCPYCINSPEMQKHMIVALGVKVYLCLPRNQSLTKGHCLIVPMQHSTAGTAVDEEVWNEIQMFRKGLTKMFAEREEDVVFLEYCLTGHKQRHMCMECIPLPKEEGDMAPMYFKKAIQESETEWSQNKKLIDTRKKDIRHSVPKGFPYFSVDFGMDGGFAHVIEDEQLFPHYFGKEILGGMLNLEPQLWRRPRKENFDSQRRKVIEFAERWKPFDWTKNIDRETV